MQEITAIYNYGTMLEGQYPFKREYARGFYARLLKRISTEPLSQAVAQLIVKRFNPEPVILFGSHARGEVGEHGDAEPISRSCELMQDGNNALIRFVERLPCTLSYPLMSLSASRKPLPRNVMTRIHLSTKC